VLHSLNCPQADRAVVADSLAAKADAGYVADMEADLKAALVGQAAAVAGKAERAAVAGARGAGAAEVAALRSEVADARRALERLDGRVCSYRESTNYCA
jgi:hypothetical protein